MSLKFPCLWECRSQPESDCEVSFVNLRVIRGLKKAITTKDTKVHKGNFSACPRSRLPIAVSREEIE